MKYILEYNKRERRQSYILEDMDSIEGYEDENVKYILMDNLLVKDLPLSSEFGEFMLKSAQDGKSMFDINGNKTESYQTVLESYYKTKEYKEIRKKELIKLLGDTDWKVTLNHELIAIGMKPKYDPMTLHLERQSWRDEINLIESED
jgi:hypothetical protein